MHFDEQKAIEIIKQLLLKKGWSLSALAKEMGIDPAGITTVFNEPKDPTKKKRKLTNSKAKKIAEAFGYDSIYELIEKNETPEIDHNETNGRVAKLETEITILKSLITKLIDKVDETSSAHHKN